MKILLTIAKFVGAMSALVVVVWGAFAMYNNFMNRFDDLEYGIGDTSEIAVEALKVAKGNRDTLQDIVTHQYKQDEHMKDMESAARYYIRHQDELTKGLMEETLEEILKKNNEIVYEQPGQ